MRDLVDTVMNGIRQQEQLQQQQGRQNGMPLNQAGKANAGQAADNKERNEELWKASLQFEAIFVQQMMSEMRKTVPHSGFLKQGYAEDVHASMMDEAIAQVSTRHSSFGIADAIYKQLEAAEASSGEKISAQEISMAADKLKMAKDLTTEVDKHAD